MLDYCIVSDPVGLPSALAGWRLAHHLAWSPSRTDFGVQGICLLWLAITTSKCYYCYQTPHPQTPHA